MVNNLLISQIRNAIKANGNNEITADTLQTILINIVNDVYSELTILNETQSIEIAQTLGSSATKVVSQKAVTDAVNTVSVKAEFMGIPKFSRIEYNEISSSNIVQGSTSLNGEIVYIDNLHPLLDGFYWYATDGKYYKWWNKAQLFKDESSYVTLPNKIFECGEDGQQYVFLPTSYNDDGSAKYGQLLNLNDTKMLDVTYVYLKNLVDNKKLTKGMQYRITDYVTTCNSAGSVSGVTTSSANHQFDIIVTADSSNTLNANARVCLHEGDTYFANNKLSEWVIKYDTNNSTAKYQWANTTNGKGVIYYMRDEFGNECAYDFKNILFNNSYTFDLNGADYSLNGTYCYENKIKGYYSSDKLILNNNVFKNTRSQNNRNNSLAVNCYSNAFGSACSDIKLGIFCNNNKFANVSAYITFGSSCSNNELDTARSYFKNIVLENGCSYNKITTTAAVTSASIPQNLRVLSGVSGTSSAINIITISTVNNNYVTKVARNSSGTIKIYNEADLA